MKISHRDALNILGASIKDSFAEIKDKYRRASAKYHPDRNPAGLEMMKLVNTAWAALSDYVQGSIREDSSQEMGEKGLNLGEDMNAALNAIMGLGLTVEICGSWIWVSGDTRPHKEILKAAGYKWAPIKKMWHFRPADTKSWSRGKFSMDEIRDRHGSTFVKAKTWKQVGVAA
jgi:hypothetical protein